MLSGAIGRRPALAAAAAAGCIAFSAIFVRLAEVPPPTSAFYRCALALPVLGLLAAVERRRFGPRPRRDRVFAAAAGVFLGIDLVFWHYSIADVGAGLATVLANLQVVFVGVLAWVLLAERPERAVLASVPVVLAGVVLISGAVGADAYGDDPVRGAAYGVITAIAYSFCLLLLRRAGADLRRPAGPLLDLTAAGAAVALLAGLALGELEPATGWEAAAWLVALALTSQVVGWLLITTSLPRLPALITSIVLTIQPVGSMILGVLLLSEEPSAVQLAGVAVLLAGVVGATAGRRAPAPAAPG